MFSEAYQNLDLVNSVNSPNKKDYKTILLELFSRIFPDIVAQFSKTMMTCFQSVYPICKWMLLSWYIYTKDCCRILTLARASTLETIFCGALVALRYLSKKFSVVGTDRSKVNALRTSCSIFNNCQRTKHKCQIQYV